MKDNTVGKVAQPIFIFFIILIFWNVMEQEVEYLDVVLLYALEKSEIQS